MEPENRKRRGSFKVCDQERLAKRTKGDDKKSVQAPLVPQQVPDVIVVCIAVCISGPLSAYLP